MAGKPLRNAPTIDQINAGKALEIWEGKSMRLIKELNLEPVNTSFRQSNFLQSYLEYAGVGKSESPTTYHRWSIISAVGALLGRQCYLPFGHDMLYPNQYIMLMGDPGARKSTAISIAKSVIKGAGYNRFGPDRSSKEQFLSEMKQFDDGNVLEMEDIEALTLDEPAEIYVVAGEFTDFIGPNNMEFVTMLTNLWDNKPDYKNPKRTSKNIDVFKPTVNILGGNTAQGFALAFPPEALGNGFMSRLIMVHGEGTGVKIGWPKPADPLLGAALSLHLKSVKEQVKGEMTLGEGVEELGQRIYEECVPINDNRFKHYGSRRYTHLLKVAVILAALDLSTVIEKDHLLKANTLLYYTEIRMPRALGEFGKSKNSDVANTIVSMLDVATKPLSLAQLFKKVATDITKITELGDIMKNLSFAGKVQMVNTIGGTGYVRMHEAKQEWADDLILASWLTLEERG